VRIHNAFRLGLFGGIGVLVAIALGAAVMSLTQVLTYVGAALFIALGLDPVVSWLERRGVPRWAAILIVLIAFAGIITGLVFAILPIVLDQVAKATEAIPGIVQPFINGEARQWLIERFPSVPVVDILDNVIKWFESLDYLSLAGGALNVGISIVTGLTGAIIVLILTLYFTASIKGLKRGLYRLVPASKRPVFIDISEQISHSVGRFVIGQTTLGVANGVLSSLFFLLLGVFGLEVSYWPLLAFLALFGSMIPLVGTITATIVNTGLVLLFDGPPSAIAVLVYYLIYMQVEAYVLSPRIMAQAVQVPGAVVVIAAIAGGTLLGLLGALVAIPTAAAIILIINKVIVPKQDAL